mmetsp:Transcript_74360/g.140744  ORF Transcript_74360/g.140744 Transcript_74360/m.140744 type:complete len:202 (-) Transcript_74360:312-917(-)
MPPLLVVAKTTCFDDDEGLSLLTTARGLLCLRFDDKGGEEGLNEGGDSFPLPFLLLPPLPPPRSSSSSSSASLLPPSPLFSSLLKRRRRLDDDNGGGGNGDDRQLANSCACKLPAAAAWRKSVKAFSLSAGKPTVPWWHMWPRITCWLGATAVNTAKGDSGATKADKGKEAENIAEENAGARKEKEGQAKTETSKSRRKEK